jgi:polysaccharide biosynthesis protein PslJ
MTAGFAGPKRRADPVTLLTIYLFFLMAIPSRLEFSALGGAGAPSTIFGAILVVWYLFSWLHPSSAVGEGRQPIRVVAVLFLIVVFTSYMLASLHTLPSVEQNGADRALIMTFGWLGVLLLTADGIGSIDRLQVLLRRIVFGATCMAALGMVQFFTGLNAANYISIPGLSTSTPYSDIQIRGDFNRPSATAIHPIEFGFVLAAILPIAIHQARFSEPGTRARRWMQVFLIAATLPLTVSRSAILGLIVCLIVIVPTWPAVQRLVAVVIAALGVLAVRAVVPGLVGELRNLFFAVGSDSSTESRTAAFAHAAPLIAAHPWFGQGFGTFVPDVLFFTDDQYLNSLIELGVVGVTVLAAFFATGWFLARSARRRSGNDEIRDLAQCLAASVAVTAVGFVTFDALYFPMAAGTTFLVLGCVGALWKLVAESPSPQISQRASAPVLVST